ncbi:tail fiber assembly protein [Lelliottia sp. RWM.1]|uniref:tail fiber assembly protein n=1 Tax=Lelliottia sp. RWM.1 TaxID=2663242 RepID=UPI00193E6C96|nr:tail fiber assembly protein [Lelliottia sp. RWM.1]MBM3072330.1 phage tail protein [Lelliottia sp. RWM.1]
MSDIFDENGNAVETTTVTVYGFSVETGEFTGSYDVRILAGTGIPGQSTLKPAPAVQSREIAVYADKQWTVKQDFREETVYSTATAEPVIVDYIGAVRDGFTLAAPGTQYDTWNGSEWVTDADALKSSQIFAAEQERQALLAQANAITADWRIELSLGIIDDEDKAKLTVWMKYIKALKAVDISTAPDVSWPDTPPVL